MSPLVVFLVGTVVTLFVGAAFVLVAIGVASDARVAKSRAAGDRSSSGPLSSPPSSPPPEPSPTRPDALVGGGG